MSTSNSTDRTLPSRRLERPLAFPLPRQWWLRGLLAVVLVGLLVGAGYLAASNYPDGAPPQGSELEGNIAGVFGVPRDNIDDRVIGDLLIERFYVIDQDTGSRYVADLMKGRIDSIQTMNDGGVLKYTLVLNLKNLDRDRSLFSAFIETVARPREPGIGEYLGLRVPSGLSDAFALNYSGILPEQRLPFNSEDNESLQEFLLSRRLSDSSQFPKIVSVEGYNYLLSNTDLFPYFRTEFGLGKAIFVSELLIVDTTAPEQQRAYNKLTEKYPRTLR